MCMTCGCLKPNQCHHPTENPKGDECYDILLSDLEAAAAAAGLSTGEAANNIPRTLRQATGQSAAESFGAMLERPTLFVDLDNVLCDLTSAVAVALNAAFNTQYVGSDFQVYSWDSVVPSHMIPWLHDLTRSPTLYRNLSPIGGAVSTVRKAKAAGYTVKLVTDRVPDVQEATMTWLSQHDVPYDTLGMRLYGGSKLTYLADYGPDNPAVLIDDNPTYLFLAPKLSGIQAWTPRYPYTPSSPDIRVFDDWHEVKRWLGI